MAAGLEGNGVGGRKVYVSNTYISMQGSRCVHPQSPPICLLLETIHQHKMKELVHHLLKAGLVYRYKVQSREYRVQSVEYRPDSLAPG